MVEETEIEQFEEDIISWLFLSPDKQEVLTYNTHLPEDMWQYSKEASLLCGKRILRDGQRFFEEKKSADFLKKVKVFDQIYYFELISNNNAEVFLAEIKQSYPGVIVPDIKTLEGFAKKFLAIWESLSRNYSCVDLLKCRVYAKTLVKMTESEEMLKNNRKIVEDIILTKVRNFEQDEKESVSEKADQKKSLEALGFLPLSLIDSIIEKGGEDGVDETLDYILSGYIYLEVFGLEKAKQNYQDFEDYIWEVYLDQANTFLITKLEFGRSMMYDEHSADDIAQIVNFLARLWVSENVDSGEADKKTISYMSSLDEKQLELFKKYYNDFLLNSTYLEFIFDGLNFPLILYRIKNYSSQTQLTGLVTEVVSDIPEKPKKERISRYLYSIYRVLHYQPGSANTIKPTPSFQQTPQTLPYNVLHKSPSQTPNIQSINDLIKIFSLENILSGSTNNLLREYYAQHSPEDRKLFTQNLEKFLRSSLEISTILRPIQVGSFLDSIKKVPGPQKAGYLTKLLEGNTFANKDAAQKLLQILVNLF